jgi:hypothetical protein
MFCVLIIGGRSALKRGVGGAVETEIELEVSATSAGQYAVRVIHAASGGEPVGRLQLDVDRLVDQRPGLENAVLASALRVRRRVPAEEGPLREVGQELFEALFAADVGNVYRASLAIARERGKKLRLVLRLTAPELSVLPWEALYDSELDAYVCRTEPLVRHIPSPYTPEPLPVELPLRILGLISSPRGMARASPVERGSRAGTPAAGAHSPDLGRAGGVGVVGAGVVGRGARPSPDRALACAALHRPRRLRRRQR